MKRNIFAVCDLEDVYKRQVYVPADDLTDPAPATTFAHLDATTVLSRKIVEQGIYPVSYTHLDVYKRQVWICTAYKGFKLYDRSCDHKYFSDRVCRIS